MRSIVKRRGPVEVINIRQQICIGVATKDNGLVVDGTARLCLGGGWRTAGRGKKKAVEQDLTSSGSRCAVLGCDGRCGG